MCGISGFVALGEGLDTADALVRAMCSAIVHRGPDGEGYAVHADASVGMRRLAIVDIEHGRQPMVSDDGGVVLVFNGEIYNAPALRAELEARGVAFRTRSDTEVILRLYEADPERLEERLAGMWAFAIHDRRRRRFVLSRDRFGIKPLFVADTGGALAFSSELQCLRPLHRDPRFAPLFRVDPGAVHAMLSWSYVPEDATVYAGVRRLPPATRLEIDLASASRTSKVHWTLRPSPDAAAVGTLGEACELVEGALRRSVREHLESDVAVATFLSGGIDSSLVTALAVEESARPVRAYSIGFREQRFDESPYARQVAAMLRLEHEVAYVDEASMRAALPDALLAYDEPFGDSSSLATFALSRAVARNHKVALGGDGGDEVFAGYKKHQIVRLREPFGRIAPLRDALARALTAVPVRNDRTRAWTEKLRTAHRIARGLRGNDAEAYVGLTQFAALAQTAALVSDVGAAAGRFEAHALERFEVAGRTQLARTLASDLANVLPNDMLTKVDRASMACSLEARVPFLDHRLAEIGVGLPARFTVGRGGKAVLKELFARRFGRALATRPKRGFGVPVESWLRGWLAPACEELFSRPTLSRHGVLSPDALADGRWRDWARTMPLVVWHAFAFAAWYEANHGRGPAAVRELLGELDRGRSVR